MREGTAEQAALVRQAIQKGGIEDLVFHAGQGEVGEEGGAVDGDAGYDALLDEITS